MHARALSWLGSTQKLLSFSLTMASQLPSESEKFEIESFVRGYHAYSDIWKPRVGEILVLQRESNNPVQKFAVAVVKGGRTVGHVPINLAPVFSHFLKRSFNKGTAQITGEKVNRGAGYGLEVTCIYCLYGPKDYIERTKSVLSRDTMDLRLRSPGRSGLSV